MKFIDINKQRPFNGQQVLIKTNEGWLPYCVCDYHNAIFEERIEGRLYWFEKEIGGWLPIEDIEKETIVHCKDCVKRYNDILCPLAQMNETYNEDDGHDYFYTWGDSEDDNFFCTCGELENKNEKGE